MAVTTRTVCATVLTLFAIADVLYGHADFFVVVGAFAAGGLWVSIMVDKQDGRG